VQAGAIPGNSWRAQIIRICAGMSFALIQTLTAKSGHGSQPHRVAYVRTVKTTSGATAVQIVWSSGVGRRGRGGIQVDPPVM